MSEQKNVVPTLKKSIGLYQGIAALTTTLLGSGIFIVPAIVATIAGEYSLFSCIGIVVFMIPVALTFGYLGSSYPSAGGTAYFVGRVFGRKFENFTSWLFLSILPIGPPVVVITGASYFGSAFQVSDEHIFFISIVMLLAIFTINLFSLEFTGKIQLILAYSIVLVLLFLIVLGFVNSLASDYTLNQPPSSIDIWAIGRGMTMTFWCFVGIETVTHLSAEFKEVKKDFPKAIIISILIVGLLYFLISVVVLKNGVYGNEERNINSLVYLADAFIGSSGRYFVGITGFITCFITVNMYVLSCSRLIYSMSTNKILFNWFSRITSRGQLPNALSGTIFLISSTVIFKYFFQIELENLILYANGVFILIYLLTSVAGVYLLQGYKRLMSIMSAIFCFCLLLIIGRMAIWAIFVGLFSIFYEYVIDRRSKIN